MNMKKKVVVGLSGGVDSSVTALLLKQEGYEVIAVYMQNWEVENEDPYCTAEQDLTDAKAVCDHLGIAFQVINFAKEYWKFVFEHCLNEFSAGRTPNPDIYCNQEIKFKYFLHYALALGADYLATGHYARIEMSKGEYLLAKGVDANKDQSYFLYTLGQAQLARCLFPLGHYHKTEVRKIAASANLPTKNKKDSTGICFIGERKFKDFLNNFMLGKPGPINTDSGETIGQHDGLMFYTIGQRKGLKIGGLKPASNTVNNNQSSETVLLDNSVYSQDILHKSQEFSKEPNTTLTKDHEPWYVISKDLKNNTLIVGQGHDHPLLFKDFLICSQLQWVSGKIPKMPLPCHAKIRYRQIDQACELSLLSVENLSYHVRFTQKQRAITSGQSIVFYDQNSCLGGGIIE
jgi:tRNA-specific 2-thiouridylase